LQEGEVGAAAAPVVAGIVTCSHVCSREGGLPARGAELREMVGGVARGGVTGSLCLPRVLYDEVNVDV
jgi:hypothetical protein